ncbi:MAG: metallophosphoesterase [Prevotella sp.]|jgi:3',5'-cyclic AMP phosphodiesterase CpdA|nr:metallophosphoesterase [Prevotella sp.]
MKYLLLNIFLLAFSCLFAGEPLKMGVITDTHYLSEQLMDDGAALNNYILSSGKNVKYVPAVLDQALRDYLQSDIQVLLICGDITKDGEKQSHLDFLKKLRSLQDRGVRIYVIPGNHDINMPNAVGFKGDERFPTVNVSPGDFAAYYNECGYGNALKRDTASLSYVAELNTDTWILAIDAARYKEYTTSSITDGRILPETEEWITDVLEEAKQQGKLVIGMMHWGLTEHILYQDMFFRDYLVDDWKRLANLFADNGVKAFFTGHFHSNDITSFTSDKGNVIYDIETGTLSAIPFSYRFVQLDRDGMDIQTKNVAAIPENPNLAEEDKARMLELSTRLAISKLKGLDYDLPDEMLLSLADVLGQVFVKHAYGDETLDDKLKDSMERLSILMDSPVDMSDIELDFYPADNNLRIDF